ncbi:MAG: response regulator [Candidatus Binatia bacterium]
MRAQHTLMIVDDTPSVREMYRDVFEVEDIAVVETTDGAEALLWLEVGKPDLIILDMEMPVMDGRSFLEYRLAHANIREIPVLVISSGLDDARLRRSLLKLGADRLLQKPVHLKELVGAVREILTTPRIPKVWSSMEAVEASGRQDARVAFTVPIRVHTGSFVETSGTLRDLSAGGLGVYLPHRLPQGNGKTITVSLDIKGRSLALMGFVQWAAEDRNGMGYRHGIRFVEKQDDSFPLYTYSFFCPQAEAN